MKDIGTAYIMNSDKTSVDDQGGAAKLYREGLEFDTMAKQGVLTEDMPKKMTKTAVKVRRINESKLMILILL